MVSSEILTKDVASSSRPTLKQQNIPPQEETAGQRNASTKRKAESDNAGIAYDKRNSIRYPKTGNGKVETQSQVTGQSQKYTNHERIEQFELRDASSGRNSLERAQSQESHGSQTKEGKKTAPSQVKLWK